MLVTEKKKISAYLPEDLKAEAEVLAGLESRSLSNLVEALLRAAVDEAKASGRMKHNSRPQETPPTP
jgi:hypothetical protein